MITIDGVAEKMEKLLKYENAKKTTLARILELLEKIKLAVPLRTIEILEVGDGMFLFRDALRRVSAAIVEQQKEFKEYEGIVLKLNEQNRLVGEIRTFLNSFENTAKDILGGKNEKVETLNNTYEGISQAIRSFIILSDSTQAITSFKAAA